MNLGLANLGIEEGSLPRTSGDEPILSEPRTIDLGPPPHERG